MCVYWKETKHKFRKLNKQAYIYEGYSKVNAEDKNVIVRNPKGTVNGSTTYPMQVCLETNQTKANVGC